METKLYYTIGEVAEHLGENVSLVRFWTSKFSSVIKPERNRKGNRLFSAEDFRKLELIHYLVKERGMTLEGAAQQMKASPEGVDRQEKVVRTLETIRAELKEMAAMLNQLKSDQV
ncbi:MAG: MerR family transcriptional regulator [Bacteroidales bacterium]|nr:MerR family transcriptional regulator [Bacteroidales bacterium]